jgi:hypothetical protein
LRIPQDNAAEFLSRITPFVDSQGARNLNAISHKLALPYQTVRFRMGRLKDQGINILPIVDVDRIGLDRIRASFLLSNDITDPLVIFGGLNQKGGLRYYSRMLISQEFDCEFYIPKGSFVEFARLMRALEELRLLENARFEKIAWKDIFMMRTGNFDYQSGQWEVDFSRLVGDPSVAAPTRSEPTKVDYADLLIIKTLEMDPWIRVVDIAKKIGMPLGDTSYHLNRHVFGRKMIRSFRMRWNGTREAWLKHSIVMETFVFRQLSDDMTRHAMSIMTSNPFTWNHTRLEDGTYMSELMIPVSHYQETMGFLSEKLRSLDLKPPEVHSMDWSCTNTFTIPHSMFDRERGWTFDAETALSYILQMIQYQGKS